MSLTRLNGRYDPFRDRNKVAYHKHLSQSSRSATVSTVQQKTQDDNDSRGNKRQLSPIPDDDKDASGWSVATE